MSVRHYAFTEGVGRSLRAARFEALRLGCDYVGTEHILLGVLRESTKVARLLEAAGTNIADVRRDAERRGVRGPSSEPIDMDADLPYTSSAKKALEYAMDEAVRLESLTVDCEHLLLGLGVEGIAAQILAAQNAGLERLRTLIVKPEGSARRWFATWRR